MAAENTDKAYRVLVIDDEPNVVTYLEMLLQDNGYQTLNASDGKRGMQLAESEKPDLICLDISMPEESGIRMYRNLKDDPELAKIPVLVVTAVTGYGGDPDPFRKFLATRSQFPAPEGFFSKPIDQEAFVARVKELLP